MEKKYCHFSQRTFRKYYNEPITLLRTLTTQEQLNYVLSDNGLQI